MKRQTIHTISKFLLAIYVPIALLTGFLHVDGPLPVRAGQPSVQNIDSKHARVSDDGICLVCLFGMGHLFQPPVASPLLSLEGTAAYVARSLASQTSLQDHPARAPPIV